MTDICVKDLELLQEQQMIEHRNLRIRVQQKLRLWRIERGIECSKSSGPNYDLFFLLLNEQKIFHNRMSEFVNNFFLKKMIFCLHQKQNKKKAFLTKYIKNWELIKML